jgi:transposase
VRLLPVEVAAPAESSTRKVEVLTARGVRVSFALGTDVSYVAVGGGAGAPLMLTLPSAVRIVLATEPVDMRKSIDGLMALVRSSIGEDVYSGTGLDAQHEPQRTHEARARRIR